MASIITATTTSGLTQSADNSGVLQLASGTGNLVTVPSSTGTMALTTTGLVQEDVWRLDTAFSTSGPNTETFITTNLSRYTTTGISSYIGSGMSQSSGVFTFPATGMYIVNFNLSVYSAASSSRYITNNIYITTDNSSYINLGVLGNLYYQGSATYATVPSSLIFNVTNTSLCKVKFSLVSENALAAVNANATFFQFIRIGNSV